MDGFVARIDTTASSTLALGHYGTYLGGSGSDFATSIATDAQGNSYVCRRDQFGELPYRQSHSGESERRQRHTSH